MRQLDDNELKIKLALKTARTLIRLKHSNAADIELNEAVPDLEDKLNTLSAQGAGWTLDLPNISVKALESGDDVA